MLSTSSAAAIPRAVDTPSKKVVQTIDGQRIVRVCDARLAYGDIVGDESLGGRLMSAGPLLDLVDRLAAALAEKHELQVTTLLKIAEFTMLMRFEGEVINFGRSSLVVQMSGYRYDLEQTKFVEVLGAFATLVAIDVETMRPKPGLPQLVHPTDPSYVPRLEAVAKQRKELTARWREMQQKVDQLPRISEDMIKESEYNHSELVPVSDTLLEVQTTFLPKNLNRNNTIFGGDVLAFMDKVALQCAKGFTKNRNMVSVSMNRISFNLPIHMHDIVNMHARVCSVRRCHLEVEVEVFISHVRTMNHRKSHTGYFTVVNLDQLHNKARISRGLLVDEKDQVSMRTLLKAQHRYAFDKAEQNLLSRGRLELTTATPSLAVASTLRGRL
ncbi:putative acyl-CoA thioester hydrolase [Phytophthora ramorum]|uniref:putative acyl-CoA thioester hydrolase n=1 Tax=Phytophthora ramorum TaxID=164328 RepID=UPI0030ACE0ED|nr:putative acyl-CoA thioester hydrolase [Phytophthora ramorum]